MDSARRSSSLPRRHSGFVLLVFNLLAEFPRAGRLDGLSRTSLRTQVLTRGAILGRSGRRLVLHLSQAGVD
jgi:hypothetical protein